MNLNLKIAVLLVFLVNTFGPLPVARADDLRLPVPGAMVRLSLSFNPSVLKGIKVHPENPFRFDFILDQGDYSPPLVGGVRGGRQEQLKQQATKLIKYFLASLTIPEKDLWVNLSPYEKDRIIPQSFGLTEMGRDLLAEDYMLKQITASLIYPEDDIGQKFWKRVYVQAAKQYGTTNVAVNTFNKVWIIPEKAVVYENVKAGTAYVVEAKLKVMLEEDYLALEKNRSQPGDMFKPEQQRTCPQGPHAGHSQLLARCQANQGLNLKASQGNPLTPNRDTSALASQVLREIVIPQLTKEVNEGKNFAQLRQVYNSLILATWYKKKIKDSILAQVYADKNKIAGIGYEPLLTRGHVQIRTTKNVSPSPLPSEPGLNVKATQRNEPSDVEAIYHRYLQAFKKGVYNYIKEEPDPLTQQPVPRKYFSGGITALNLDRAMLIIPTLPVAQAEAGDLDQVSVRLEGLEELPIHGALMKDRLKAVVESTQFEGVDTDGVYMDAYFTNALDNILAGDVIKTPKKDYLTSRDKERFTPEYLDAYWSFIKTNMGGIMAPFIILENVVVNGQRFPRVVVQQRVKVFSKQTLYAYNFDHLRKYYDRKAIRKRWSKRFDQQLQELMTLMVRRCIVYDDAIEPFNLGLDEDTGQLYFIDFGQAKRGGPKYGLSVMQGHISNLIFAGVLPKDFERVLSLWGIDRDKDFPVPDIKFFDQAMGAGGNEALSRLKGAIYDYRMSFSNLALLVSLTEEVSKGEADKIGMAAYYNLFRSIDMFLKEVNQDQEIYYIYPFAGPDVMPGMFAPTFRINDNTTDFLQGVAKVRELLAGRPDVDLSFKEHKHTANSPADAYSLNNYEYALRASTPGKRVLILKGFSWGNPEDDRISRLLADLMSRLSPGDKILILDNIPLHYFEPYGVRLITQGLPIVEGPLLHQGFLRKTIWCGGKALLLPGYQLVLLEKTSQPFTTTGDSSSFESGALGKADSKQDVTANAKMLLIRLLQTQPDWIRILAMLQQYRSVLSGRSTPNMESVNQRIRNFLEVKGKKKYPKRFSADIIDSAISIVIEIVQNADKADQILGTRDGGPITREDHAMTAQTKESLKALIESTHFEGVNTEGTEMKVYFTDRNGSLDEYVVKIPVKERPWVREEDEKLRIEQFAPMVGFVKDYMGGIIAPFTILENVVINGIKYPRVIVQKRLKVFSEQGSHGYDLLYLSGYYNRQSVKRGWPKKFINAMEGLMISMIRRGIVYKDSIRPFNLGFDEKGGELYFVDFGNAQRGNAEDADQQVTMYASLLQFLNGGEGRDIQDLLPLWGTDTQAHPVPDIDFSDQAMTVGQVRQIMDIVYSKQEIVNLWSSAGISLISYDESVDKDLVASILQPHFQQIINESGFSAEDFIMKLQEGKLSPELAIRLRDPVKRTNRTSKGLDIHNFDPSTVKVQLKRRFRSLVGAHNEPGKAEITLGGTRFNETAIVLGIIDEELKAIAGELRIQDVDGWIKGWDIKVRALSIETAYLVDINKELNGQKILHREWVKLEYMDLLDPKQWERLSNQPADAFFVVNSLYLGEWAYGINKNGKISWTFIVSRRKEKLEFIKQVSSFVKQGGIFITEVVYSDLVHPNGREDAPQIPGFDPILGPTWLSKMRHQSGESTRTGVYVKKDNAMKAVNSQTGGIDLTPANMNLQTKVDSRLRGNDVGIKFHIDLAMLQQLQNAPGFVPVIINIQPLKDLQEFLGGPSEK